MSCITNMNKQVAALLALHICAKSAHWNVRGPTFIGAHKLFGELSDSAMDWADTLAEHLGFLDKEAESTARIVANSYLGPYKIGIAKEKQHFEAILNYLTRINTALERDINEAMEEGEQVIADVFIEISRGVSKYIYLIKSHLK